MRPPRRRRLALLATALAAPGAAAAPATPAPPDPAVDPLVAGFPAFAAWFRAGGGTVDDRVAIAHHAPRPGLRVRGLVATAAIPAGTLLMRTPASLLLSPDDPDGGACDLPEAVIAELRRGAASAWHAYLAFDDSDGSRVPSEWGREGGAVAELQGLPPTGHTHNHVEWYRHACLQGGDLTALDWTALKIYLTRSADIGLIPMYDLMNHHNGLINTDLQREAGGLAVYALADIPKGAPLYNTYARGGGESTVDVFNTYGFVEDYPQLWRWSDDGTETPVEGMHGHFGQSCVPHASGDCLHVEPNAPAHEVLVLSPTLAALRPSRRLVKPLGNARHTPAEWEGMVAAHHANLRAASARGLGAAAKTALEALPTTVEEDEARLAEERRWHETERAQWRADADRADTIQAIEYRVAFKRALQLALEVAEAGVFFDDADEL